MISLAAIVAGPAVSGHPQTSLTIAHHFHRPVIGKPIGRMADHRQSRSPPPSNYVLNPNFTPSFSGPWGEQSTKPVESQRTGRIECHHRFRSPPIPGSLHSQERSIGGNSEARRARRSDAQVCRHRDNADCHTRADLLYRAICKPIYSRCRADPDRAAGVLAEVISLRIRESVIAKKKEACSVKTGRLLPPQPQTSARILK